jgi:hypothetical protein
MKKNLLGFMAIVLGIFLSAFTTTPSAKSANTAQYWFDGQTFVLEGSINDAKIVRPGCIETPNDPCLQGYGEEDVDNTGDEPVLLSTAVVNEEIFEQ